MKLFAAQERKRRTLNHLSFGSVVPGYAAVLLPHRRKPLMFRKVATPKPFTVLACSWSSTTSVPSARQAALIASVLLDGLTFGVSAFTASV